MLEVNYTSKINKLIFLKKRERSDVVTRGSGGRENGIKMVKRYKTPVKNSVSAGDVMYDMIKTTYTAVCYKAVESKSCEFSSQGKSVFFFL